jgi:hypothetical protein
MMPESPKIPAQTLVDILHVICWILEPDEIASSSGNS